MIDEKNNESMNSSDEEKNARSLDSVSSDDLDGDMNLSDNEDQAMDFRAQNKKMKQAMRFRPARHYRQEIDTNVFKIGFSTLKD